MRFSIASKVKNLAAAKLSEDRAAIAEAQTAYDAALLRQNGEVAKVDLIRDMDVKWRGVLQEMEKAKKEFNDNNKAVGQAKKNKDEKAAADALKLCAACKANSERLEKVLRRFKVYKHQGCRFGR